MHRPCLSYCQRHHDAKQLLRPAPIDHHTNGVETQLLHAAAAKSELGGTLTVICSGRDDRHLLPIVEVVLLGGSRSRGL
jgi:hypothetical protein